mmetsp:Transcript_22884/g.11057  ORF Transcript_22884/g.11057 Transcript_22884/m.11057 type:complete len:103 (+) Transcript_22884:869-1177(+)
MTKKIGEVVDANLYTTDDTYEEVVPWKDCRTTLTNNRESEIGELNINCKSTADIEILDDISIELAGDPNFKFSGNVDCSTEVDDEYSCTGSPLTPSDNTIVF